jgi:hypothetical protein
VVELDPRWDWIEVTAIGDREPRYIKGQCKHLVVVRVESGGEVVARLCLTCDCQLPA